MFPAPSAPPPPRWERTRHLDPLGRWRRVYRVAQRWRFRRRIAGILLDLCKGVSSLRWSAGPLGEPSRTQRQTRVRRVTREASVTLRVLRTILEEDGTVEQALRRLLAAFRLVSRVARAWPWGHTATAASTWYFATRTSLSASGGAANAPKAALSYIPGWKSLLNVTVTKVQ